MSGDGPLISAYELTGVTDDGRETVLSYEADDAGNIEMRIDDAEPLHSNEQVLMWLHGKLEDVQARIQSQIEDLGAPQTRVMAREELLEDLIDEAESQDV